MIILIALLPLIAYLSMTAFAGLSWTTKNYEGHQLPYSLGILVIFGYAVFCDFTSHSSLAVSLQAVYYVVAIWLLGLIDDRFGHPFPKGLRGHFYYIFTRKSISTGMLKLCGTLIVSFLFTLSIQPASWLIALRSFLLLSWFPHVMNLFDTRPLRVWKLSLLYAALLLLLGPALSFLEMLYITTAFYLVFILDGHKKAMLGDNGATTIGAILAVFTLTQRSEPFQWGVTFVLLFLLILAERISFSRVINQLPVLRWIDQIGVFSKKSEEPK